MNTHAGRVVQYTFASKN